MNKLSVKRYRQMQKELESYLPIVEDSKRQILLISLVSELRNEYDRLFIVLKYLKKEEAEKEMEIVRNLYQQIQDLKFTYDSTFRALIGFLYPEKKEKQDGTTNE